MNSDRSEPSPKRFDFDLGAFSQVLLVDLSMFDFFKLNFIKFLRFVLMFLYE